MTREKGGRRPVPRPFSSWWGAGEIVEETFLPAPDPVPEPCLQLVRFEDGRQGLRFSHYHGRRWGRDPLVVTSDDVADLRRALGEAPGISRFLGAMLGTVRLSSRSGGGASRRSRRGARGGPSSGPRSA